MQVFVETKLNDVKMLRTDTFGKYLNTGKKAVVRYWEHYSTAYGIFVKGYVPIP